MKYLLNIFDLDGTLIDSHEAICRAMNDTALEFGLPEQEYEKLKRMIGMPLDEMLKFTGVSDIKKGFETYRRYYFQYIEKYQRIYPGIKKLLDRLQNSVLLAIATNKSRIGTLKSLEAAGINGYFDFMVTESELKHLKPHTESLKRILSFYKSEGKFLELEDILMIGDSPIDIEFADNCGIDSTFAGWGFYKPADLKFKPTYSINKPRELIRINSLDETVEVEITSEIDLHTFRPDEVEALVKDYLGEAKKKGLKTVRIIMVRE